MVARVEQIGKNWRTSVDLQKQSAFLVIPDGTVVTFTNSETEATINLATGPVATTLQASRDLITQGVFSGDVLHVPNGDASLLSLLNGAYWEYGSSHDPSSPGKNWLRLRDAREPGKK